MSSGKIILTNRRFKLTLERLCHELIENYGDFENTCFVGIQPKGVYLADRLVKRLIQIQKLKDVPYGKLDITFYRDDFRTREEPLAPNTLKMDFLVEDKKVILIDDVLYSGRTVQAALMALQHYGRPSQVELVAFIDRRFNRHLPIQSDYIGMTVDALDEAYVKVEWEQNDGDDQVLLFANKQEVQHYENKVVK